MAALQFSAVVAAAVVGGLLFGGVAAAGAGASYSACQLCMSGDCCNATVSHNAGRCRINSIATDVMVAQAPGRAMWFSLGDGIFSHPNSNEGDKTLYASFAMFQAHNQSNSWHQTFKAQALEAYSDDALIYSSSASSSVNMCTRRWGCIECASSADAQYSCAGAGLNATIQMQSSKCMTLPQLQADWKDSDGSPATLSTCLSTFQNARSPAPVFGASWALNLGAGVHLGHEVVTVTCL